MPGLLGSGEAGQDAEFVATEASHQVAVTHRLANDLGHGHQQLVAGVVAEAVVDALEVIDVEKHHPQAAPLLGMALEDLGEGLIEGAAVVQVGEGIVVRGLLQRSARLVELADQGIDPLQVVFLALQLAIGPGRAQATYHQQQGDDGDAHPQLPGIAGALQGVCGLGRGDQHHGPHASEVHGGDRQAHHQGGGDAQPAIDAGVVATEDLDQLQGGEARPHGDADRQQEGQRAIEHHGLGVHRGHAGVVHEHDAHAQHRAGLESLAQSEIGLAEGGHGHESGQHHDQQRGQGDEEVVVHPGGHGKGQHGDEVHAPDAEAEAQGAHQAPGAAPGQGAGLADALGEYQGDIAGADRHQIGEGDQPAIVLAVQVHLLLGERGDEKVESQPVVHSVASAGSLARLEEDGPAGSPPG